MGYWLLPIALDILFSALPQITIHGATYDSQVALDAPSLRRYDIVREFHGCPGLPEHTTFEDRFVANTEFFINLDRTWALYGLDLGT